MPRVKSYVVEVGLIPCRNICKNSTVNPSGPGVLLFGDSLIACLISSSEISLSSRATNSGLSCGKFSWERGCGVSD